MHVIESNGEKLVFQLVMPEDADATKGLISTTSPIGRAFLNKEPGDTVKVDDARRHARVRNRQAHHHPRRSRGMTESAEPGPLLSTTSHRPRSDRHRHGRRLSRRRAARAARSRRQDRYRARPRHRRHRRAVRGHRRRRSGSGTRRDSGVAGVRTLYPWRPRACASPSGRWRSRSPSWRSRWRPSRPALVVFPIDFVVKMVGVGGAGGLVGRVPAPGASGCSLRSAADLAAAARRAGAGVRPRSSR